MIQLLSIFFAYLYCLYCVAFRWRAIITTYGHLDLLFWVSYVAFVWRFIGWLADIALWMILYGGGSAQ